ncbi:hypothetical protein B0I35DRAFT_230709 [Stachybotrys elegans]|uniref:Uncharacterized protein n=1 Tax=Stachybotrys elegans TaxID=80388 RepID=A0A8K0SWM7_9HYPO|nr:hypothetical protein B0I35DRAFT_230709 [Stachybotrys elegans]
MLAQPASVPAICEGGTGISWPAPDTQGASEYRRILCKPVVFSCCGGRTSTTKIKRWKPSGNSIMRSNRFSSCHSFGVTPDLLSKRWPGSQAQALGSISSREVVDLAGLMLFARLSSSQAWLAWGSHGTGAILESHWCGVVRRSNVACLYMHKGSLLTTVAMHGCWDEVTRKAGDEDIPGRRQHLTWPWIRYRRVHLKLGCLPTQVPERRGREGWTLAATW